MKLWIVKKFLTVFFYFLHQKLSPAKKDKRGNSAFFHPCEVNVSYWKMCTYQVICISYKLRKTFFAHIGKPQGYLILSSYSFYKWLVILDTFSIRSKKAYRDDWIFKKVVESAYALLSNRYTFLNMVSMHKKLYAILQNIHVFLCSEEQLYVLKNTS